MLLGLDYEIKCVRFFFLYSPLIGLCGVEDGFECTRFEGLVDQVDCRFMYVTSLYELV